MLLGLLGCTISNLRPGNSGRKEEEEEEEEKLLKSMAKKREGMEHTGKTSWLEGGG